MAQNRRDLVAGIATVLGEVTELKTVVRSYVDVDATQYAEAAYPLAAVIDPPEDVFEDETSRHAVMDLTVRVNVMFVAWGASPSATYEALVKAVRDKIGAHFTLHDKAIKCQVDAVSEVKGEMPLYNFDITLNARYHLNEQST